VEKNAVLVRDYSRIGRGGTRIGRRYNFFPTSKEGNFTGEHGEKKTQVRREREGFEAGEEKQNHLEKEREVEGRIKSSSLFAKKRKTEEVGGKSSGSRRKRRRGKESSPRKQVVDSFITREGRRVKLQAKKSDGERLAQGSGKEGGKQEREGISGQST